MTTTGINAEMLEAAEYTVGVGKRELSIGLDYSVNSLQDFDSLIAHVRKHFGVQKGEGKLTDQTVQRASISLGAYLGEVIRRRYGGTWVSRNGGAKLLVIDGQDVSPIPYIFQRLTQDSDYVVELYWSDLSKKITSKEGLETENPALSEQTWDNAESSMTKRKDSPITILAGVGLAVLCLLVILGGVVYSNIRAANEFRSKLNPFLTEAGKLTVMTEQGVTFQEFRSQLIEVKSAYEVIDDWPASYRDEKRSFDLAMRGWDYALEVWEIKLGVNDPLHFQPFYGTPLIDEMGSYLGIDKSTAAALVEDGWIERLMGQASIYFEAGKAGVR